MAFAHDSTIRCGSTLVGITAAALLLASTAFAQPAHTSAPVAQGTPSVLPRPDYRFQGDIGRTVSDSDPAQFPQPVQRPPMLQTWC